MRIVDGKQYMDQVKRLLLEYTGKLGRDLTFQGLDEELKDPGKKYTAPEGELLVALDGNRNAVGMIAYHRFSDECCEMKRLYVAPECRGEKLGEQLIEQLLSHAKQAGYREMVLDTIVPLRAAIHLYQKFGFQECEPYYNNPMDDAIYMKKVL